MCEISGAAAALSLHTAGTGISGFGLRINFRECMAKTGVHRAYMEGLSHVLAFICSLICKPDDRNKRYD